MLFVFVALFACKDKDDSTELEPVSASISGQWEFIISPDEIYLDTTIHNGVSASDFEYYSSVNDQVYLYQNKEGDVIGTSGPFKLSGKITGVDVELTVYVNPDGLYVPERPIADMIKMSVMKLQVDGFGNMEGHGSYEDNQYFQDLVKDKYTVLAKRTSKFDKSLYSSKEALELVAVKGIKDDICKVIFSISSWIISSLTDGVVRTMSSDCWLHKDGGGYYAFGHDGPGSLFPILTQSIYYPFEWSACQVRAYGFEISIGTENISYEVLKNSVINSPPVKELYKKLGFENYDLLGQALDDFYNEFGGFGISIFYDTHTNNLGLYVNHEKGSSTSAENSVLVQAMAGAFDSFVHTVYVRAGSSVHQYWHLRRSDFLVCNTPIFICYVIGTHHVSYN